MRPAAGTPRAWSGKRRMVAVLSLAAASLPAPAEAASQEVPARWERRLEASEPRPTIFHASVGIHLPTAETLARGEWQFEISHRFFPALSDGAEAFWGLDGPVNMRIGLGYALSDRAMATLARSNVLDSWDLQVKLRALEGRLGTMPVAAALLGGVGLSSDVPDRDALDSGNFQYYGQVALNARLGERWAVGVVPSYLHNLRVEEDEKEGDAFLGLNTRVQVTKVVGLEGEWNLSRSREDLENDMGSFGIELETGGHFFKIFLTNSVHLNPGQYLAGSPFAFEPEEWRLGFTITRLLRF